MGRSVALMLALAGVLVWQIERLVSAARWTDHSDQVIAQANRVQKLLLDQETGLRGFLMSKQRVFLEPYEQARPEEDLAALARIMADNPDQVARVRTVQAEYVAWHAYADAALVDTGAGETLGAMLARKDQMDSMRQGLAGLIEGEERLRSARGARVARETLLAELGAGIVMALAGGALAFFSFRESRRVIHVYDEALQKSTEAERVIGAAAAREREAREEAQRALRVKDEFLWMLGHELRTPLTAVLGWVHILRARQLTGEALARALATIERSAKTQARIVDDLLDASRIETGKIELTLTPTKLDVPIRDALDTIEQTAAAKGVALDVAIEPAEIAVMGDPERLQQVVWNLLSNAVKFTPRGGHVEVRAERRGDRVAVRVRDTGEGIAPEFLPHVFDPFRQADSSMKRAHGGLGLGLSIVRYFVDRHGGTIEVESPGQGGGATFTFTLPVVEGAARAPSPIPPSPRRSLAGIRVLLVEDDPDSLEVIGTILRAQGAAIQIASQAEEALAILSQGGVDVLISDIGLPGVDGYELLQRARAESRRVPALALTAFAAVEDVQRAERAGFERHIAKPFNPDHLVRALADLTSGVPREGEPHGAP